MTQDTINEKKIKFFVEGGTEVFDTDFIEGHLDSLIIDSSQEVSVTINSKMGYPVFHTAQHKGIKYYAPRAVLQGWESRLIVKDQFEKFLLNEPLEIMVAGPKDTEVTIILRIV